MVLSTCNGTATSARATALSRLARAAVRRGLLPVALVSLVTSAMTALAPSAALAADTSPPTQPGAITSSSVTATSATLKWGTSRDDVGIEGYRVYRGPATADPSALSLIATTDAVASYSATKLYSGTSYKFGIVAIDAANNKSSMQTTTLTTSTSSDTTAPNPPSSSSVTGRVFSDSRIDLVWGSSSSADVAGYQVWRNGVQLGTVDLPGTARFSDNGLSPATSYSYVVKAVDSAGNVSTGTTARSVKTLASGTVIIARGPYLSNVTATSAIVSWWTNVATPGSVSINGRTFTDGTVQHHAVTVTGLSAGTSYPYSVGGGGATGSGTLTTSASPGQTFSFATIGDFGGGSTGESQNAANIAASGTAFIQTVGDNIYPSSGLPDPNFTTTYSDFDQRFFKPFANAIKNQAFFPANGNKEYYGDGEFWDAFPMPGSNHSWYSYNWGDAHILVLDSEQPMATGSDQYNFAQADLAAHQSEVWRIVAIQRPPYSSTTANSSSKPVQQYLVPLFQAQHVNLVLSGNSHNYERTYPLLNGVRDDASGITYVVSGGGGNGFNAFSGSAPAYSAFRESSYYQYAKVTVSPSALTVDAIRADTQAIFDTTKITRSGGGGSAPSAPTGLAAGTPTSTSVSLSWNANASGDQVSSYKVYRGSTNVGSTAGTSFTDTGLAPSTSYSYTVTAVNGTGESKPSAAVPVTTAAGGGTGTVATLLADATIDSVSTAKPTSSRLKVDAASPVNDMLLKFSVPSTCPTITGATLTLTVGSGSTDPSGHGGDFYATSTSDPNAGWSESTVHWDTAPAKTGNPVSLGKVLASTSYSLNVTSLVPANGGTFSLRGTSTSSDGAGYFSKEGGTTAQAPQLSLTCSS